MLSVVVSGIVSGLLYAVAGLGLVAVYRTSRVINFAMGGMGAVSAYGATVLLAGGLPYLLVFPIAILVGAVLGLLVEFAVARPLKGQPPLTVALGTLGVLLVLQGLLGAWFGYQPRPLELALADAGTFTLGPLAISANQLLVFGLTATATVALLLVVSRTTLGLTMRAASSGPQTSALLGVDVSRTRLLSWVIGGAYGSLAAMLLTPLTYLTPSSFTIFLLTAFAAVVLGGFTSIGGVVIGAVVFGVGINLLQTYLSPELVNVYVFVGIALVLVLRPHGLFGQREHEIPEPEIQESAPVVGPGNAPPVARPAGRWAGWLVGLVLAAALPFVMGSTGVYLAATALATYIGVLGLNILVGWTGQVSLGQSGFLAVGGVTASVAAANGIPVLVALPLALVAGAVVGLLIGLPAGRLSGIYLVLLTLTFAVAVPELVQYFESVTGGADGLPLTFPDWLGGVAIQYWFVLALAALVTAVVLLVTGTRLGRGWRAVRDSEDGAQALGMRPALVKLGGFALSSALVALSGAIGGLLVGFVTPASYGIFLSIYALLAVVLGGTGSVLGSLLGAVFVTVVPTLTQGIGIPQDVVFGLVMLAVLLLAPTGIAGLLSKAGQVLRARLAPGKAAVSVPTDDGAAPIAADPGPTVASPGTGEPALLELRDVHSGYGLVDVLHGVSLRVRAGEVVALVGANGVGKSTLLRTISGTVTPSAGSVLWRGTPLRTPAHRVARAGIGHVPEGRAIFPDLTVAENLRMGAFGIGNRGDRAAVGELLDRFPVLAERAAQRAGTLSGGQQQILAIARALMGRPDLLMLDEPSLGLAPVAAQQVFGLLREIAAGGVAVLLVEQNVQAALALADHVYVVSRGRVVLDGTAADLRDDERIGHTYFALGAS